MSKTYCVAGIRVPLSNDNNHAVIAAIQENEEHKGRWDVVIAVGNFDDAQIAASFGKALRPVLDEMLGGITYTHPITEH